jgi:hypothetical protein
MDNPARAIILLIQSKLPTGDLNGIFDLWKLAHNHFDPTFHPDAKTVVKLKGAGSPKLGEYRPNP